MPAPWLLRACLLLAAGAAQAGGFAVFDATAYRDKPDLSRHGIRPAAVVYSGELWREGEPMDQPPAPLHVQDAARAARKSGELLVLDVEHWPLRGGEAAVQASLAKYQRLLALFKLRAAGKPVGYYGLPVGRDFWRAVEAPGSGPFKEWQKENDALKPLAEALDASLPSLYTFYPDQAAWVGYAVANLAEARRVNPGKPVYAFLWPRFHDSNPTLGGRPLPADFWRLQLETARRHADGVVIWGGWGEDGGQGPARWNEDAPWWKATLDFLKTLHEPD